MTAPTIMEGQNHTVMPGPKVKEIMDVIKSKSEGSDKKQKWR